MKLFACITIQMAFFQLFMGFGNGLPQSSKAFFVDIDAFHDKHQHVLVPTSLVTGAIHLVAEKTRDHVLSKKKDDAIVSPSAVPATDLESSIKGAVATSSSKRPTLFELMSRPKRSADADKGDCGCKGKISIADGIAEHVVDKNFAKNVPVAVAQERELEEIASAGHHQRSKRSNQDNANHRNPSPCSSSSCFALFSPKQSQQPQSDCLNGNCDRVNT